MSEVHSLLSVRSSGGKERVKLPRSCLCVVWKKERRVICSEKANSFSHTRMHTHTHTDTHTCTHIFFWVLSSYSNSRSARKQSLRGIAALQIGFFPSHLPMQAVWCWVNPGGHLHVKLPMVLTHRNWQLCCLVAHSSRSIRKCKMGIGIELKPRYLEAALGSSSWVFFSTSQMTWSEESHSKWLGEIQEIRVLAR